jgi:hypothetical protein
MLQVLLDALCPQEIPQSTRTMPNKVEVTNSNPPSPLLYRHVKIKNKF